MKNEKWRQEIGINTFLGAWTNMHIGMDELKNYYNEFATYGFQKTCNSYNYILPNSGLINELIAKTKMLISMSEKLGLNRKDRVASSELADLERLLGEFKNIIRKELQGEQISDTECGIMLDFSSLNSPQNSDGKKFYIDNNFSKMPSISENLDGYKLLAAVYKAPDGKMILAIGPIFNYKEKNR
jgi:hypothetical protein